MKELLPKLGAPGVASTVGVVGSGDTVRVGESVRLWGTAVVGKLGRAEVRDNSSADAAIEVLPRAEVSESPSMEKVRDGEDDDMRVEAWMSSVTGGVTDVL